MRLLVVNPNTTASMTATIAEAARAAASAGTEVVAVNPAMGPESIEGYYDEALSLPGLLEEIARGEAAGFDAHVIACFDDSGLDAARALARAPVLGICEAAMHVASMSSSPSRPASVPTPRPSRSSAVARQRPSAPSSSSS